MSQISKALKKVQEVRQNQHEPKAGDIVYLTDAPKVGPKNVLLILLIVTTVVAILISLTAIRLSMTNSQSKQIQVLSLESTIKIQDRKIHDLSVLLNKTKNSSDSQIRDLSFRLKKVTKDVKAQINYLVSTNKDIYDNLKEAILDDKQQIDSLNQSTKNLEQKIEKISATESQAKDLANPANGT